MFRIALRYLLVTVFVSGVVALIWWGHASAIHIKHVDYVPPPITAPDALNPSRTPRVSGLLNRPISMLLSAESVAFATQKSRTRAQR
jgi:hypothetical protein